MGLEQIGEVRAQLLCAQIVWTAVEIFSATAYGAAVRLLGGLGLSLQLQRALHALVRGGEAGLFYNVNQSAFFKNPSVYSDPSQYADNTSNIDIRF
jgi:hypothetical protein